MTRDEFNTWLAAQDRKKLHKDQVLRQAQRCIDAQQREIAELERKVAEALNIQKAVDEAQEQPRALEAVERIRVAVVRDCGASWAEIQSRLKPRRIAHARQIFVWLCRRLTSLTLTDVGGIVGGRDHSTMQHAQNVVEAEQVSKGERWRRATRLLAILQTDIAPPLRPTRPGPKPAWRRHETAA